MKLNLGCGKDRLDGYENIDLIDGKKAFPLDYVEDGSCEEIRASHILEHFPFEDAYAVLANWTSKLADGGTLKIAVPNFKRVAKNYLQGKQQDTQRIVMGGHVDENDFHKAIYDIGSLTGLMESVGLKCIKEWDDY